MSCGFYLSEFGDVCSVTVSGGGSGREILDEVMATNLRLMLSAKVASSRSKFSCDDFKSVAQAAAYVLDKV